MAAVHKIFKLTDKRCVLVVDRGFDGFDGCVMFENWLDNKYRFVTRQAWFSFIAFVRRPD